MPASPGCLCARVVPLCACDPWVHARAPCACDQAAYQAAVDLEANVNAVMRREEERLALAQLMDREGFEMKPNPSRKLLKDANLIKVCGLVVEQV